MILVHHLNNSRSQRVLWLLEELELPYEIKKYDRDPETLLAPATLRAVHPLGKSPVLEDDGQLVAESGAIIEYLLGKHGQGRLIPPPDSPDRLRFTYWLHYAEGSAMPQLLLKLIFERLRTGPMPFLIKPIVAGVAGRVLSTYIDPQLARHLDYLEDELGKASWFAGPDFTAADIQMSFVVEGAKSRGALGNRPRLTAFLQTIHARPAYRRALERGGPYSFAD